MWIKLRTAREEPSIAGLIDVIAIDADCNTGVLTFYGHSGLEWDFTWKTYSAKTWDKPDATTCVDFVHSPSASERELFILSYTRLLERFVSELGSGSTYMDMFSVTPSNEAFYRIFQW